MTSVLVPYGTGEGQTAKVAAYVDSVLSERGFDVTTVDLGEAAESEATMGGESEATTTVAEAEATDRDAFDATDRDAFDGLAVEEFDAVLVGASVDSGGHQPAVVAFVERHAETLADRPTGFFQVSLASAVPSKWGRTGAERYVDRLEAATGWHPDRVGLFAGALQYTQYDRRTRWFFKLAALALGLGTDASRDHEYTDWDDVERFAVEFGTFVEQSVPEGERTAVDTARKGLRVAALSVLGVGLAVAAYRLVRGRRRGTSGRDRGSRDGDRSADGRDRVSTKRAVDDTDAGTDGPETDEPEATAIENGPVEEADSGRHGVDRT